MKLSIEFSTKEGKQFLTTFFSLFIGLISGCTKLFETILCRFPLPMFLEEEEFEDFEDDLDYASNLPVGYQVSKLQLFRKGDKVLLRRNSSLHSQYPNIFTHPLQVLTISGNSYEYKPFIQVNDFLPFFNVDDFIVVEPDKPKSSILATLQQTPYENKDRKFVSGSKVFCSRATAKNGMTEDQIAIVEYINLYELYEVERVESSPLLTFIKLVGVPRDFNTVNFIIFE